MRNVSFALLIAFAGCDAGIVGGGEPDPAPGEVRSSSVSDGTWFVYDKLPDGTPNPASAAVKNIQGKSRIVAYTFSNLTFVGLYVYGLPPNRQFGAHVHRLACDDPTQAGGHYRDDAMAPASAENEVWLDFTTNRWGQGVAFAVQPWLFRAGEAKAIVVHDHETDENGTAGPKLACTPITLPNGVETGTSFSNGTWTVIDPTTASKIGGKGRIGVIVPELRTRVQLKVTGLAPYTTYGAHVHRLACADATPITPAHYRDDFAAPASAENEVWLDFDTDENGAGEAVALQPWLFRAGEAKSIAIHAHETDENGVAGAKIACTDIEPPPIGTEVATYHSNGTWTVFDTLPDGTPNADAALVAGIGGNVRVGVRTTANAVSMYVNGLPPWTTFGAHVHMKACADGFAGGHYEDNPAAGSNPDNEVWLDFTTDWNGEAYVVAQHPWLFRAGEAKAVVIHDHETDDHGVAGPKLACTDVPLP
jgi:Cu-Zn family superoxide dismutase